MNVAGGAARCPPDASADPICSFHSYFHQIDNFKKDYFLWATAGGCDAAHERNDRVENALLKELDGEGKADDPDPDEGEG